MLGKLIPIADEEALREAGIPFARSTLYKYRHYGRLPGVVVKLGGRLFLDLEELRKIVETDKARQREISGREGKDQ